MSDSQPLTGIQTQQPTEHNVRRRIAGLVGTEARVQAATHCSAGCELHDSRGTIHTVCGVSGTTPRVVE